MRFIASDELTIMWWKHILTHTKDMMDYHPITIAVMWKIKFESRRN